MDFNLDLYVMPIAKEPRRVSEREQQPKNITADNPANDFHPCIRTGSAQGRHCYFLRQTTNSSMPIKAASCDPSRARDKNR